MWKILVVDDNFINRQLMVDILKKNADCDVAVNGKEAIEAYNYAMETGCRYDLILLDIAMPEINGLEFLKVLREHEQKRGIRIGQGIPVIMVTAHKEEIVKAFHEGCDDYVVKPVDPRALIAKITEKIGSAGVNKEDYGGSDRASEGMTEEKYTKEVFVENSKKLDIPYDAYKRIVEKACTLNEEYLHTLSQAIDILDYKKITFVSHSVKGVYENLMISDIAAIAERIYVLSHGEENIEKIMVLRELLATSMKELQDGMAHV